MWDVRGQEAAPGQQGRQQAEQLMLEEPQPTGLAEEPVKVARKARFSG
mgnify:CR=1 FL=1